jgi:hypothetical protein
MTDDAFTTEIDKAVDCVIGDGIHEASALRCSASLFGARGPRIGMGAGFDPPMSRQSSERSSSKPASCSLTRTAVAQP